jgi:hypothetical protein
MKAIKSEDRLSELCARALSETDRDELIILFREINHILFNHILQVQRVIERNQQLKKTLSPPPQRM